MITLLTQTLIGLHKTHNSFPAIFRMHFLLNQLVDLAVFLSWQHQDLMQVLYYAAISDEWRGYEEQQGKDQDFICPFAHLPKNEF